jgi:peptidyl-tRNA hydrolase, PTH1 family
VILRRSSSAGDGTLHLIVGLGNPGLQYEQTRHNAGFMAVDRLLAKLKKDGGTVPFSRQRFGGEFFEVEITGSGNGGSGGKVFILKPLRFMNCSGSAVVELAAFYKVPLENILVMYDDYAFNTGVIKVKPEGGHGGHNGLRDIERVLGTQKYARVRIGIDPKPPQFDDPADWVLSKFSQADLALLSPALDRAADAAIMFVKQGLAKVMNAFNASEAGKK